MNKIINYTLLFLLFLISHCSYEPILKNNYKFSLNLVNENGDKKINSIITNKFKNLKNNEKKYDLVLTSNKEKNILSKDTEGDPSIFELIINVKYIVTKNGKTIIEKEINRKTTYNNISDKFELENYENTIIKNLCIDISDKIIFSIAKISE